MKVLFSTTVSDYIEKVESLLLQKEASNHVMLGLLNFFKTTITSDVKFGYIENNGEVIYAFMKTPPNQWILADVDGIDKQTMTNLAIFLYKKIMKVEEIQGPVSFVQTFVDTWEKYKKIEAQIHKSELIYRLDRVRVPPNPNEELALATKQEHALIKSWLIQYGKEAKEYMTEMKADQLATKYIENKSLYLWKMDGRPVSMANQSMRTNHGASINAVFTPDPFKRQGYATNIVAALSQKLLDDGYQFCCLYTDRENPTSNRIYQKIGYEVVGESVAYVFS